MKTPAYKRPYDVSIVLLFGLILLPVWLPLCLLAAAAIWLCDRGPVLYMQERLGKDGRVFRILKFRTMVCDAETDTGPVWAKPDDPRVTRVGRILRPLQIDELPQAINVLRGEMSLVGPRPERPELAERFEQSVPGYGQRLKVMPGLAGLAHVRGSYWTPPRDRLRYDNLYMERMSPVLDTEIILLAVMLVARRLPFVRFCTGLPGQADKASKSSVASHPGETFFRPPASVSERQNGGGADGPAEQAEQNRSLGQGKPAEGIVSNEWSEGRNLRVADGVEQHMGVAADECRQDNNLPGRASRHIGEAAGLCLRHEVPQARKSAYERTVQKHRQRGENSRSGESVQDAVVREVSYEGKADQNLGVDCNLCEGEGRHAEVPVAERLSQEPWAHM